MKINKNSFELNEQLQVVIDSNDNDGLMAINNAIKLSKIKKLWKDFQLMVKIS